MNKGASRGVRIPLNRGVHMGETSRVQKSDTLRRTRNFCCGLFSVLLFLAISAVSLSAADEGERLFEQKCGKCHGIGKSRSKAMTEKEWRSTVLRMIGNGADISRDDTEKIIAYLAKNHPRK